MRPISPISYISNRKETLNSPNSLIQQMEGKLNCSYRDELEKANKTIETLNFEKKNFQKILKNMMETKVNGEISRLDARSNFSTHEYRTTEKTNNFFGNERDHSNESRKYLSKRGNLDRSESRERRDRKEYLSTNEDKISIGLLQKENDYYKKRIDEMKHYENSYISMKKEINRLNIELSSAKQLVESNERKLQRSRSKSKHLDEEEERNQYRSETRKDLMKQKYSSDLEKALFKLMNGLSENYQLHEFFQKNFRNIIHFNELLSQENYLCLFLKTINLINDLTSQNNKSQETEHNRSGSNSLERLRIATTNGSHISGPILTDNPRFTDDNYPFNTRNYALNELPRRNLYIDSIQNSDLSKIAYSPKNRDLKNLEIFQKRLNTTAIENKYMDENNYTYQKEKEILNKTINSIRKNKFEKEKEVKFMDSEERSSSKKAINKNYTENSPKNKILNSSGSKKKIDNVNDVMPHLKENFAYFRGLSQEKKNGYLYNNRSMENRIQNETNDKEALSIDSVPKKKKYENLINNSRENFNILKNE